MNTQPRGILMDAVYDAKGYGPEFRMLRIRPELAEDAKAYALKHMREDISGRAVLFIREDNQHEAWTRGELEAWSNPPPNMPLESAVGAAAREIATQYFHNTAEEKTVIYAAIIQKHFQPLLAKVEGERNAANQTVWNREQDILGLRREQAEAFSIRDAALNKCSAAVDLLCESLGWQDRESALRADLAAAKEENKHFAERRQILHDAIDNREKTIALLKADLAAKEADAARLEWLEAGYGWGSAQTGPLKSRDRLHLLIKMNYKSLRVGIDAARSALASRADKGGAT